MSEFEHLHSTPAAAMHAQYNQAARLLPAIANVPESVPVVYVGGVAVAVYVEAVSGTLVVAVDVEDVAPDLCRTRGINGEPVVALEVTISGRTVFAG